MSTIVIITAGMDPPVGATAGPLLAGVSITMMKIGTTDFSMVPREPGSAGLFQSLFPQGKGMLREL